MVERACGCTFGDECNGLGTLHCNPPCGGDLCICLCGGELECTGCCYCVEGPRVGDKEVVDG